jgi:hypothetical protein
MKKTGTTKKHAGGGKHHAAGSKHHPQHESAHERKLRAHDRKVAAAHGKPGKPGKTGKAAKTKQLALGEGVACCSAEALAASLRLAGWPVSDADVYALYRLTSTDDNAGADIQATLETAMWAGLAGVRVTAYWPASPMSQAVLLGLTDPDHAVLATPEGWWSWGQLYDHGFLSAAGTDEAWELRWDL